MAGMTWAGLGRRAAAPLASRKVRVAIATVVGAFAAQWGWNVSDELVLTILGVGVSLILGIAHEDAGRWTGQGMDQAGGEHAKQ